MYMLIFGHVLQDQVKMSDQVSYTAFLVPGLVMMSVLQNALPTALEILVQSKIMGSLVFVLLTPLSHWHWFAMSSRPSFVWVVGGLGISRPSFFGQPSFVAPFVDCGVRGAGRAALMGSLGVIAGLWSEGTDQMAAFKSSCR
jgi:ABC-2 type transport system permease protein